MRQLMRPLPSLFTLCIVCAVSMTNCYPTDNRERSLQIPALGRTALLGHRYNEVVDEFLDVSIFNQAIPEAFISKAIKLKLTTASGPANTYQEKFKLLNIQETAAANVLAGFTQVEGSASFLNDDPFQSSSAPNEVSWALIQKYRTVKESLEFYFSNLKGLYNVDILNHKDATHVVTGITYGANTAVLFKSTANTAEKPETETAQLFKQMELLTESPFEENKINSTFKMSITSDVPLPFKTSSNLTLVYNLLQEMPARISNLTDGKGLPVSYTLTPVTVIKRFLLPSSEPGHSANKLHEWILKDIISYFDEIRSTERKVNRLNEQLNSQPNCLLEETKSKIDKLRMAIQSFKSIFQASLKKALEADRSGDGDGQALLNLTRDYRRSEFNADNVTDTLSQFKGDLKRAEFCADLVASYPHIEFIGNEPNFDFKISQFFNQSIYVLFIKADFANSNNKEPQANLYTFLNKLNQPENKLYIVDCAFRQAMCGNVTQSVIHLYRDGRIVSPKVDGVYEEEVGNLQLQISQLNNTLEVIILDEVERSAELTAVETEVTRNRNDISALRTGQAAVTHAAAAQNQHPTRVPVANTCEVQKPAFITNATKSASFGCGETIQLPSNGQSIVVDLKLSATNGVSQQCLWTLDATQNNELVWFKVKLTLLCKTPTQILDGNTLTFTEWHNDGPTNNKKITTSRINSSSQNPFLLSNYWDIRGFLSCNAKTTDSETDFILRFDVLETSVSPWDSSSSATYNASVGSASYSIPSLTDLSSIVINPQPAAKMTLTVDVDSSDESNPCVHDDSVDILEFGMDGVPKQMGRLCGRPSAISYETENPVAALFLWDSGRSGRGVKLSWK